MLMQPHLADNVIVRRVNPMCHEVAEDCGHSLAIPAISYWLIKVQMLEGVSLHHLPMRTVSLLQTSYQLLHIGPRGTLWYTDVMRPISLNTILAVHAPW